MSRCRGSRSGVARRRAGPGDLARRRLGPIADRRPLSHRLRAGADARAGDRRIGSRRAPCARRPVGSGGALRSRRRADRGPRAQHGMGGRAADLRPARKASNSRSATRASTRLRPETRAKLGAYFFRRAGLPTKADMVLTLDGRELVAAAGTEFSRSLDLLSPRGSRSRTRSPPDAHCFVRPLQLACPAAQRALGLPRRLPLLARMGVAAGEHRERHQVRRARRHRRDLHRLAPCRPAYGPSTLSPPSSRSNLAEMLADCRPGMTRMLAGPGQAGERIERCCIVGVERDVGRHFAFIFEVAP